jgi:hypothetical protein
MKKEQIAISAYHYASKQIMNEHYMFGMCSATA